MNKQPEITEQTKRNLIDSCFKLIGSGQKATVNEITKTAGYNRSTFYRYFTDARELLDKVEDEICSELRKALNQNVTDSTKSAVDSLAAVYTIYGKYLSVLVGQYGDPVFREKMRRVAEPYLLDKLNISSGEKAEIALKTEFVLSAVLGTVNRWYEMAMPISTERLAVLIVESVNKGLGGTNKKDE